jgi:N utilization substance protein B
MLFAIDAANGDGEDAIRDYWRETPGDAEGRPFADALVRGVVGSLSEIDELIATASANWRMERMTCVDRNVLRVGAYELARCPEIPRPVAIDEAVELAKRFGSEDSSGFVNGVLDRIADNCGRTNDDVRRAPAAPALKDTRPETDNSRGPREQ